MIRSRKITFKNKKLCSAPFESILDELNGVARCMLLQILFVPPGILTVLAGERFLKKLGPLPPLAVVLAELLVLLPLLCDLILELLNDPVKILLQI